MFASILLRPYKYRGQIMHPHATDGVGSAHLPIVDDPIIVLLSKGTDRFDFVCLVEETESRARATLNMQDAGRGTINISGTG